MLSIRLALRNPDENQIGLVKCPNCNSAIPFHIHSYSRMVKPFTCIKCREPLPSIGPILADVHARAYWHNEEIVEA